MAAAAKMERVNAVIYARYSSTNQNEQSIEGQINECHAFAQREGFNIVYEYVDRALSGKNDDRPQFLQMIKDSAKRQFSVVIVWKLDRFSRNRFDSAHYKHLLKKNGVKVVSATERISDDPEGIILEGVLEATAEYFSANLAQNVKRGQRENMAKGLHVGGYAPYGYKVVDKKLVVIEEEARIIRYAFEEYAKGVPKKKLREALALKGLVSRKGTPIADSTLYNIFKNKKYIGVYEFGEGEVVGGCDPIVDNDIFEKVQEVLAIKARGQSGEKAKEEYLLSGKVFCGMCGKKLFGNSSENRKGIRYSYYQCMGRKFDRDCLKKSEKKDYLEWYVVEQTCEYVLRPDRIDYIAARIVARYDKEFSDSGEKDLEKQLARIEKDINDAVNTSIRVPDEAKQIYIDKVVALAAQKADLEHELTIMRIATRHRWTEGQIVEWLKKFVQGEQMEADFQRRIIDLFINSVFVYDDKIIIYYNIKGGKQVSHVEMIEDMEESIDDIPLDADNMGAGGGADILDSAHSPLLFGNNKQNVFIPCNACSLWDFQAGGLLL